VKHLTPSFIDYVYTDLIHRLTLLAPQISSLLNPDIACTEWKYLPITLLFFKLINLI